VALLVTARMSWSSTDARNVKSADVLEFDRREKCEKRGCLGVRLVRFPWPLIGLHLPLITPVERNSCLNLHKLSVKSPLVSVFGGMVISYARELRDVPKVLRVR